MDLQNLYKTEEGFVDNKNSTNVPLTASQSFTGDWTYVVNYAQVAILANTDVEGTLIMQFSTNGSDVDGDHSITETGGEHVHVHVSKFFRIVYTNGGTNQTYFRLQAIHSKHKNKQLTETVADTITDATDLTNVRAVLVSKKPDGNYANATSNYNGSLTYSIDKSHLSAFGELDVVNAEPVLQQVFSYNINSRFFTSTTGGSGTIDVFNSTARIQTGTTAGSTAILESLKKIKYRPGQGCKARFTGVFSAGDTDSTQYIGLGDVSDGVFFAQQGTTWGVLHRNSASGSIVDTFYASSSFNVDVCNGTGNLPAINPLAPQLYQIQYEFLGYGLITFYVGNPLDGLFYPVHTVSFNNDVSSLDPLFSNPTLPFCMDCDNGTTTTNVSIRCASIGLFVEGQSRNLGLIENVTNSKTGIGATETAILTIRNKSTFASKTNRSLVFPLLLNVSSIGGNKPVEIFITQNTTLGGTPVYTDVSTNTSVIEFDTAGTTLSGGTILTKVVIGKEATFSLDISKFNLFLDPTDTLTISASTSSGSAEVYASLTYRMDI